MELNKELNEQEIWGEYGANQKSACFTLGAHTSFQFSRSPRRLLFGMSRYKFAQKMIGRYKDILELGCSDGFYAQLLAEKAKSVFGVDFDEEALKQAKVSIRDNMVFACDNFLGKVYGKYDAVVSFDVIEHTLLKNEDTFMETVCKNLTQYGIAVIGTPNILAMPHSCSVVREAHVNEYSAKRLKSLMDKYFHNAFMFSQNDEMVHTGFSPMAHYLIAIGCCKKEQ